MIARWCRLPSLPGRTRQILALSGGLLLLQLALLEAVVLADDCQRDWRRAEDCLRTPGFAEGLGTAVGTIVTVLVNGAVIAQTVFTPRRPPEAGNGDGDDEPEQRHYSIDLLTQDQRTELTTDGVDRLWVYGRVTCDDPEVDTGALTRSLRFTPSGRNATWLQISAPEPSEDYLAVSVQASPPRPESRLSGQTATLTVVIVMEEGLVSAPLTLALDDSRYEFEIVAEDEPAGDA